MLRYSKGRLDMAKVRKAKKQSPIVKLFSMVAAGAVLVMSGILITGAVKEVYTTFQLKNELSEVKTQYTSVQDENVDLQNEKDKLEDPAYVQNYARGTQLLSKDGEQVFVLPKGEE